MAWRKREPPESRVRETVAAEEETLGIPLRPSAGLQSRFGSRKERASEDDKRGHYAKIINPLILKVNDCEARKRSGGLVRGIGTGPETPLVDQNGNVIINKSPQLED